LTDAPPIRPTSTRCRSARQLKPRPTIHLATRIFCSTNRGHLMLHRNDQAVECLSIGKEIVERNGYDTINANLTGALATALARTGKAHESVDLVEACMESGMHLRTGQMEVCYLHAGYAEALVRDGESQHGLSALERALSIAKTIRNPWQTVECLGLRARLLAETKPDASRVAQDLAEMRAICDQYGVVAWNVSRLVAQGLYVS